MYNSKGFNNFNLTFTVYLEAALPMSFTVFSESVGVVFSQMKTAWQNEDVTLNNNIVY